MSATDPAQWAGKIQLAQWLLTEVWVVWLPSGNYNYGESQEIQLLTSPSESLNLVQRFSATCLAFSFAMMTTTLLQVIPELLTPRFELKETHRQDQGLHYYGEQWSKATWPSSPKTNLVT